MQPSHTSLRSGTSACDPPEEDRAGRETIAPRFASMNSTGWPSISGLVVVYASLTRVRLFTFGREALLFFLRSGHRVADSRRYFDRRERLLPHLGRPASCDASTSRSEGLTGPGGETNISRNGDLRVLARPLTLDPAQAATSAATNSRVSEYVRLANVAPRLGPRPAGRSPLLVGTNCPTIDAHLAQIPRIPRGGARLANVAGSEMTGQSERYPPLGGRARPANVDLATAISIADGRRYASQFPMYRVADKRPLSSSFIE